MAKVFCENGKTNLYKYTPSLVAAILFTSIFVALTAAHLFRMIRSKQWFMTAFIVGGVFEIIGFIIRIAGHNDPCLKIVYILQYVLILLAPSIFSATIYMILGRTIRAVQGDGLSLICPARLTKIFVAGDVLCFSVQGAGGGILSGADNDKSKSDLGKYVILGGLILQIILFGIFVIIALVFHLRLRKNPTKSSHRSTIHWATMLYVLYGVSLLIMVRNIFRVIEYAGGREGYLLSHEWTLYVFDAVLMAHVMGILLWWFPSLIRPREVYSLDNLETHPVVSGINDQQYRSISTQSPPPPPLCH
ncbi:uncharacterized protein A1O9_07838 [Exophiala aquamarina CBS 119918]|uniref:RTA1 like protein n=1 Tax=Exophiala aquamarina CBS 119918 TaxID=1182545 RepID=A0A072P967_9EURO|nr:uncharacterized protein A1O9_07838 [Exophiala aquamarina CBS 119918]KEF56257.1 hypothetical protein A1O9_07838 [Exophiala aquamarina CBS 119918]